MPDLYTLIGRLPLLLMAVLVALDSPELDTLAVGDEVDLTIHLSSPLDYTHTLQWRNYDLLCKAPTQVQPKTIHCKVVNVRVRT